MSGADEPRPTPAGRLLTFAAWSVLVLGLWLWGREITGMPPLAEPARAGGPVYPVPGLPAAHSPLAASLPVRIDVPSLGIEAPVIPRGLDAGGAIDPPPYDRPGAVGWWRAGVKPGEAGAALMVGHVDTASRPAVFYGLSSARQGGKVRVVRADGSVAEFTIEDVQVYERTRFDPDEAYGPRIAGRAELRLVTCGGTYDKAAREYTANVVVSAYLTGTAGDAGAGADAGAGTAPPAAGAPVRAPVGPPAARRAGPEEG
ncbi:class F sortase [Streptomyces sp. NPDC007369]|uniref:class F sortase n=1 Tax=Streptomyces sp. NPDC007369 TaxID=3154589 RepID=UPI0033F3D4F0